MWENRGPLKANWILGYIKIRNPNCWARAIGHYTSQQHLKPITGNYFHCHKPHPISRFNSLLSVLSAVNIDWIKTKKKHFGKLIAHHLNASLSTYKNTIGFLKYYSLIILKTLTNTISSLPLKTLAIRKRDDISSGVDATLCTAAPHALHGLAGAIGTAGVQRTRLFAGWTRTLTGVS